MNGKFLTNEQIDFLQNALDNAKKANDDALKTIEMQKEEIYRLKLSYDEYRKIMDNAYGR